MRPGAAHGSAYTPSHMEPGTQDEQRRPLGLLLAASRADPDHNQTHIGEPNDGGTAIRSVPHPRERSVE